MSNTFTAWIELPFIVHYDFQKMEPRTRHYPGCPAAVVINTVTFKGKELPDELFNWIIKEWGSSLEERCWEDMS